MNSLRYSIYSIFAVISLSLVLSACGSDDKGKSADDSSKSAGQSGGSGSASCYIDITSGNTVQYEVTGNDQLILSNVDADGFQDRNYLMRVSGQRGDVIGTWQITKARSGLTIVAQMAISQQRIDLTNTCKQSGRSGTVSASVPVSITDKSITFLETLKRSIQF